MRITTHHCSALFSVSLLLMPISLAFCQATGGGAAGGGSAAGAAAGAGTSPGAGVTSAAQSVSGATGTGGTAGQSANGTSSGTGSIGALGTAGTGPGATVPNGSGTSQESNSLFRQTQPGQSRNQTQNLGPGAAGRLGTPAPSAATGTATPGLRGRRFSNQNSGMFQNDSQTNKNVAPATTARGRALGSSAATNPRQNRDARLLGNRQAANLVEQATVKQSTGPTPTAAQTLQSTTTTFPQGRQLFINNENANAANSQAATDASAATAQQNARAAMRASSSNLSTDNLTQPASTANGARSNDLHDFSGPSAAATVTNSAASQLGGANTNVTAGAAVQRSAPSTSNVGQPSVVGGVNSVVSPFVGGTGAPSAGATVGSTPIVSNGTPITGLIGGEAGMNITAAPQNVFATPETFTRQLGIGLAGSDQQLVLANVSGMAWAAYAGLQQGDRIVGIGGQTVSGFGDLANYVQANPSGRTTIAIERNGQIEQVQLDLGSLTRRLQSAVDTEAVTAKGRRIVGTAAEAVRAARLRAEQSQLSDQ